MAVFAGGKEIKFIVKINYSMGREGFLFIVFGFPLTEIC
jgi:hypothetical protein